MKNFSFTEDTVKQYANIYCEGKSFDEACPDFLKEEWNFVKQKYFSHLLSIKESKIDLTKNDIDDIIPCSILEKYSEVKNKICKYIFNNYEKPGSYDLLVSATKVAEDIKKRILNFDEEFCKKYKLQLEDKNRIIYKVNGTITGRFSTEKDSFPILNLKKEFRNILKPNNDFFLSMDYNAFEPRIFLSLCELKQPKVDIHEWNRINVFKDTVKDREEAKKEFFSWIYNINNTNSLLNEVYDRTVVLKKFYHNGFVKTVYGKKIESDLYHALNYIVQSTAAYLFLEQVCKVYDLLKKKDSFICFLLTDSIVIDLKNSDNDLIIPICDLFKKTRFGEYLISVKIGKNFRDLNEFTIKEI